MYRSGIVLIIIVLISFNGIAQQIDTSEYIAASKHTEVNSTRFLLVGGTLISAMAAIHIYQQNGWWKNNRAPFHFQEDLNYGLWVDKIGHFYGGSLLAFVMAKSLEWANVPEENALWIGAGGSLLFQSYVEIEDGFSKWGFDRVDWVSNLAGALWNPARYYAPFLQNFDLKLSYHPSELIGTKRGIGFQGQKHIMIDDYEGQTFWLSMKVKNLLPHSLKSYYPSFLCLALGYGARDIATANPYRVYFIALDLDMTKIIPDDTPLLKTLGEALNFIHFPMPAVQFAPRMIWYGLYF